MADLFTLFGRIAIDSSGAKEEIDEIVDAAESAADSLDDAGKSADDLSQNLGENSKLGVAGYWMGTMLGELTKKAAALIAELGKAGINYNANMEQYVTAFATMMGGNTEKAAAFIEEIRQLGSVTPLGMEGLAANAQTLMGFGIAAEDVISTLRMLGDAAQGNQQKLDSMVLAYSQIMAAGKMNAQDANQMVNAGVPIWSLLSEYLGASVEEVRALSEEGAITSEMVTGTLQKATSEGGLYFEAMSKQAETFNGQISTLKDNADQTLGTMFQPFFEVLKSDVLPKLVESLSRFSEWITNNQDTLQSFAETVGDVLTTAFDAVITGFQWLVENGETVYAVLGAITGAFIVAAVVAHPYATAIMAVVAGLAALSQMSTEAHTQSEILHNDMQSYTQAEIDLVNGLIEANNNAVKGIGSWDEVDIAFDKIQENAKALELFNKYSEWKKWDKDSWLGLEEGMMPELPVSMTISEDSEGNMQGQVDDMALEGSASIYADENTKTLIQAALNNMDFEAFVTLKPDKQSGIFSLLGIPGFASGIDRVPHDMLAVIHKDETVLKASDAAVYRGEKKARNNRNGSMGSEPVNVTLNFNGSVGNPFDIAAEVKNALEMLRWGV